MSKQANPEAFDGAVVDARVLDPIKEHVFQSSPVKEFPCRVCGKKGATERSDGLCWICRRLKISAWREAQEAVGE